MPDAPHDRREGFLDAGGRPMTPRATLAAGVDPHTLMDGANPHGPSPATRCTARSKQTGDRCEQRVVPGRSVCHYHGGKTPVGTALPQYKGAGRSRHLPVAMVERYRAAASDPELLALRKDLALIEVRLTSLLEKLTDSGPGDAATWADIRALL
ncbi:hypothetical protein L6Q96_02325 [Candidatus Binatia bacterium]|nr:hypothetical protein [Candidatus Binatia bacterium]